MILLLQALPPWHTASEMRTLATAAHTAEGALLLAVAVVAIVQAFGFFMRGWQTCVWPVLFAVAGLVLVGNLMLAHGFGNFQRSANFVFHDAQQRQHFLIGIALAVAGSAEWIARARRLHAVQYVFPLMLLAIGLLFAVYHVHAGFPAVQHTHRQLGVLVIASAVARVIELSRREPSVPLRLAWPVLLLPAAFLLLRYREPDGAYEQGVHHHMSMTTCSTIAATLAAGRCESVM